MSKKGNLSILGKRMVEGSEKSRVGVCSVYTMRHCLQGPCQGPLHIPPKENVMLYDQKVKEIKIVMILLVRVHSIAPDQIGH